MHNKEKAELPKMSTKISIKLILELFAAFSIAFSILWEIKIEKDQNEWNRKIQTLQFLEKREKNRLKLINDKIGSIINDDSITSIIKSDTSLNNQIRNQLNEYEDIAIGFNIGIYDGDVIKRFIGTSYSRFNKKMQAYIKYARLKNSNPNLFKEYDLCVSSLQIEDKK